MKSNKKILSPKIDIVFKMLFGEQKHERITKKLIEDVIEEKIDTIELEQTPYLLGMQPDDKIGIVDIRATINNKNPLEKLLDRIIPDFGTRFDNDEGFSEYTYNYD